MEHHAAKPHSGGGAAGREPEQHWVQFYETDASLADEVARFLAAGFQADEAAVVIATQAHRDAIEQRLCARELDVSRLVEQHRLVVLDAEATLAELMAGGEPRRDRFLRVIGGVLERLATARPGTRVRAYGEMVDVLWRAGQQDAAIRLEEMWNDLRGRHELTLLCACGIDFYKEHGIPRRCATHSEVARAPRLPADRGWDLGGPTPRRRVLVVDDNEDAGELLAEMLGTIGHEVRVATDGRRALELVETFTPDVAILDIGLPVMDGYALAAALRERLGAAVRLLAVTGYGREQDKRRAMQSGFDSHFVKPVPLQTVLAAIAAAPAPELSKARPLHE